MKMKKSKLLTFGLAAMLALGGAVTALSLNAKEEMQQVQAASEYEIHFWPVNQGSGGIGQEGIWHWGGSYVKVPETSKIKINSGSSMMPCQFYFTILDEDLNKNNIKSFEFNIKLHADMSIIVKRGYDDIFVQQDITADNTWVKVGKTTITGTGNFNFNILNKKGSESNEIYFETPNLRVYSVVEYPVYIAQGTGVSNVFLSTSSSATSGSSSGTNFEDGQTVYAFATLANGYSVPSGWTKVSGNTYRIGSKKISGSSYDFGTASASATKYTISYSLNGGTVSGTNPTEYYVTTSDFTLINPTKTGYTFNGWSGTGISGTSTSVKVSKGSTGNRSYTANWTANTYTVRFNENKPSNASGSVTNLPGNATWTYDSNATLPAAPVLPGWTFGGWYKEAACTNKLGDAGQTLTKPNLRTTSGNYDLYAKWTANTYSAVYNGNKPAKAPESYEVTNLPSSETWTYDSTGQVTLGSAPSLTGYDFDGWYKDAECTNKLGDAGQMVSKPNLTTVNGGTGYIYAKWVLNSEIQAVVNEIVKTKTVTYEGLTNQIAIADEAYDNLALEFQPVVDSEGYTQILNNAKAADAVGQMIEDLGPAQDTQAWREQVEAVRLAYNALLDKTFIPNDTILKILEDDEAAIVVMDAINAIGTVHWNPSSKALIDDAQDVYDAYITAGHPHGQVANYDTLVQAHTDYNNVQTFVDKVNAITLNPFEYTDACKALIDEARRYFEQDLSEYQKSLATSDAASYYNLLVNYENAYHAMYLIDQINDMEDNPSCGEKIEAARNAVNALNPTTELPLINATLMKELTDKEAAWGVMELINAIYPMVYGEDCEQDIQTARDAYTALTSDQKPLVVNYVELTKAEADYIAVKAVVVEVNNLGDIRHDEASLNKIESARNNYEALTNDQKGFYPGDSLQTIVDYETAYEALDKIYNIGGVSYNSECETRIDEARHFYDNLTEEQKALIHQDDLQVLINAEASYNKLKKEANILVILLLIVVCSAIACGAWFLFLLLKKKRNKDDDDNKGKKAPVKAMSVTGFLPLIMMSHYFDPSFLALYVLAGIAVALWIVILVIFLVKKHKKANQVEEEEVKTVTDKEGNTFQIRYIKSFTAKLIQANEDSKVCYEDLKNFALSYKNTSSRVSWNYDSISAGRKILVRFAVRGKTLCVYFPEEVAKHLDDKHKVEQVESKKFEATPYLYRIKNPRRHGYAKALIAEVAKELGLTKGELPHESYILPYEENKPLIARGLIKELKVQVKKKEEPEVLEVKVNADGDEIVTRRESDGHIYQIRYIKSFTAKLSQASEEVIKDYNDLKNYALSYKKASSRISWHYDSINVGGTQALKFGIRGKTLVVYYGLNLKDCNEKYKVEEAKAKRFLATPTLYRVKNDRRREYARELIDLVMKKLGIEQGEVLAKDYSIPYETTEALLAKGLVREFKMEFKYKGEQAHHVEIHHVDAVSAEEADSLMSDEDAEVSIEEDKNSKVHKGKKAIVNLDELEANFNDGDTITLEALQEKKMVGKDIGRVKLLARGKLDKKFHVDLQEYSLQAVKMILLVGGTVQRAK